MSATAFLSSTTAQEDLGLVNDTTMSEEKSVTRSMSLLSLTDAELNYEKSGSGTELSNRSLASSSFTFDFSAHAGLPFQPLPTNPFHGALIDPSIHAGASFHSLPSNALQASRSVKTKSDRRIKQTAESRYLRQRGCRVYGLAATIPPEILDIIASYLADCVGIAKYYGPACALRREKNSNGVKDNSNGIKGNSNGIKAPYLSYQPLRSCSLVCRRWANICRYSLFSGATLVFTSSEVWEEFVADASRGCPSLVPVYKLIEEIQFIQRYQSTKPSFCYRIRDVPRGMLDHIYLRLDLLGPVPPTFPPGMLSTPHWSTPPTLTTPHSLLHPFYLINVTNVHMPSLLHVLKFIRYVAYTSSVYDPHSKVLDKGLHDPEYGSLGDGLHLNKLTWDSGKRQRYPFRFRSPYPSQPRPYDPQAFAHFFCEADECTSNIRLCTYVAIAHPHCWMHWLPMAEQEWILALMQSFEDYFVDITCACCWVTIEMPNTPSGRLQNKWGIMIMDYSIFTDWKGASEAIKLTFYFEALPRNTTSKTSVRILGLRLQLDDGSIDVEETSFDIDALIQQLRKTSPGRLSSDKIVILVSAGGYNMLQELMKRYRPVILDPLTEAYDYLFTYRYWDSRDEVAVDPVTLIPTGQSWKSVSDDDDGVDIIASLCKIPLASDRKDEDEDD